MSQRDTDLKTTPEQCYAALEAAEGRFRNIIDRSADGILIVDRGGLIRFANPAAQQLFGRRAEQLTGEPFGFPIVAGETSELTVVARKGRRATIEMRVADTQWEGASALLATLRDVTEQKLNVEALRRSEERYAALVRASAVTLYSMSPDWSEMLQLEGGGFLADTKEPNRRWLDEYIFPEDQQQVRGAIDEAVRAGTVFEVEHRVRRVDGSMGWTLSRAVPIRDADGMIIEWFGAASDITERKQAEEALRASEERLQKAISIETVGVLFFNLDGRILGANNAFQSMSSYTEDELRGIEHWQSLTAQEFWTATMESARRLATNGKTPPYEKQMVRKDGSRWWGLFAPTLLEESDGNSDCIEFVIEITESKRGEEEIKRLNAQLAARAEELEAANQELEAFNYTVAHDLRNPLNVINGYCQAVKMLCGSRLGEECGEYVELAYQGTLRMNRLIDALLNFSRMARVELSLETVDLSALAGAAAEELMMSQTDRKVTFRIAEGIAVHGDASLLRAVMDNFLGNALKYTEGQGEAVIEFGKTETSRGVACFVRDNGAGFAMAEAEKLFTPFQRLTGAEGYRGFGIGLATVERIIRRHGGRVWAEGEPGKGATFYFTLPPSPEHGVE